jgi:hypothetical protein
MRLCVANGSIDVLVIVNVTKDDDEQELDDFEIRINHRVIGKFKHKRKFMGAAQCLRDAADALDANPGFEVGAFLDAMLPVFERLKVFERLNDS